MVEPTQAKLWLLLSTSGRFQRLGLPTAERIVIGRAPDCDVVVTDSSISRHHAVLHLEPAELEDLGSRNGTFLLGRRLASGARVALEHGAVFTVGSVPMVVTALEPDAESLTPEAVRASGVHDDAPNLIVRDPEMQKLHALLELVAPSSLPVLVLGETGTGKEVFASEIHRRSLRARQPFLRVNCATLSGTLLDSELFGHERGAFTGAVAERPGLFERADGGTVFLDEVAELPLETQAKLLRVLECGEVMRLGATRSRKSDVRFVSATHHDPSALVAEGRFRRDLLYRLNGFTLSLPALGRRPADIVPLAEHFLARAARERGGRAPGLAKSAIVALEHHTWPGNVRELKNAIERAVALCRGPELEAEHLGLVVGESPPEARSLDTRLGNQERDMILEALRSSNGVQKDAAKLLGISRRSLLYKIELYGIPRPRKKG